MDNVIIVGLIGVVLLLGVIAVLQAAIFDKLNSVKVKRRKNGTR